MSALLYTIFFCSGASALIFETLWFRQAGLAFGNSVWASSLVLSGFMGGLALGNALAARYGPRLRNPVRVYAIAEVAIAITGVGLVYLFPILGALLAPWLRPLLDHAWILNAVRLVAAFVLLLVPSTAMGITLPLLTRALTGGAPLVPNPQSPIPAKARRIPTGFGPVLGRLYGWNTLGAMVGVIVGDMYLVAALGVRGTALAAAALNLLAAGVAGWIAVSLESDSRRGLSMESDSTARRQLPAAGWSWLAAAFLSGFCLLALEVVWFRFLLLFVKGHSGAFPLMLAIVLAGIALGGLAASFWLRRRPDAHRSSASVAFLAGLACIVSYASFPTIIAPFALSTITIAPAILRIGVPLMFPVSFLSGIVFTFLGAGLREHLDSEIATTGVLTLANTTGAALGSLAAGLIFLPVLGMERSFLLIALLYGAIGVKLSWAARAYRPARRGVTIATAGLLLASLAFFPFGSLQARLLPITVTRWAPVEAERRVVAVREGLTETVIDFERLLTGRPVSYVMLTNSFSMSTNGYGVRRYQKLYVYWPMAVHPDLTRALLIGYGVGNTAKAMTDSPSLRTIDIVDLSRDILAMSPIVFPNPADQPLRDPRVRVHIEDGRYFLQATDRHFDLITGEPPPPGIAGVENLYSREYFQLLRDRLDEGGIATYWLPLADLSDVSAKAILGAFCAVFDDCSLWNGSGTNLMMIGTRHAQGPGLSGAEGGVGEAQFTRQWNTPAIAAEMARLGVEQPGQLGALFIGDAAYLRGLVGEARPLTDDDPKLIEAPFSSPEAGPRLLASVTDVAAARQRFEDSALIARLWPTTVRTASLPFFDLQDVINAHMYGDLIAHATTLEDVHRVATESSLTAPSLWRLASNADIQQVVSNATPAELADPLLQFHLGVRLLSERKYDDAAQSLALAEASPEVRDNAFVLQVYALCMAGRTAEAQTLSRAAFRAAGATTLPPVWIWMRNTFGINPQVEK